MNAVRALQLVAGVWAALMLANVAEPAQPSKLEQALAAGEGWAAWRAPSVPAARPACCMEWHGWKHGKSFRQGCTLGPKGVVESSFGTTDGDGALPPPKSLVIYARVERGAVRELLAVGDTCPVESKAPVRWLEPAPEESVAFVAGLAADAQAKHGDNALHALGLHAGREATAALERIATGPGDEDHRRQAAFWLGEARGAEGLAIVRRIAREDRDPEVRAGALFAMSQSGEPGRFAALREAVDAERDPDVRREGYLWVAQSHDPEAHAYLEAAVARERDEDGLRGAVFALSELPKGQGVDALVRLARRHDAPPRVRREALFWLGQSHDPRAMQLLDEILNR